jgi:RNA polymerase sigma-70 factor (ECF subfamily)
MPAKAAHTEGGVSALEGSSSRAHGDPETEAPEACGLGTRFGGVECGAWGFRSHGPAPALNGETKAFALNGGADPAALNGGAEPASSNGEAAAESDENLLARLRDGEEAALGQLWSRYAALLYSQALAVLHNPTEAEDVVAEVFSEVWRRAAGYHPERARPVAWLVTLVRRRSIDRLRERRSYEKAGERLALENGCCRQYANSNGEENHGDGVEEQVHLSEVRALLEQALQYLPERQRETVCMVYFHGLTQKEIAARTSTPLGTVKTRLELGLRKMRERIRGARLRSIAQDRGS